MPRQVIRDGQVRDDTWEMLDPREGEGPETVPLPAGPLAVPLAVWEPRREELLARATPLGVRLEPGDDPARIAPDLARLALVCIHFPRIADGRGYSSAWLLRRRHGYAGELRAVGEVLRDQLFYLARCGFDAFVLREGADPSAALSAFADFTEAYQWSADGRGPGLRGREAHAGEPACG
ncbi:MAG: DUF934 domain-containing protein [Burkholderiales bacterium]